MAHRINMKGSIGQDFSGNYISEEIDYYDGESKAMDIHINGYGGDVQQANSVMASMHTAISPIDTYNMGFACSSLFQVWLSGRSLFALDYARFMCHDPSLGDGKTIEELDDDDPNKVALIEIRSQISEIISNRTGMEKSKVLKLMKAETWFDVEKMENIFGLDITVLPTKRQPNVKKNATIAEFVNIISKFTPEIIAEADNKTDNDTMADLKNIANKLDLSPDAANLEDKVVKSINTLQIDNTAFVEKEKTWNAEKKTLEDKIKKFEDSQKDSLETEATAFVDTLVEKKIIREEGKEGIKKLYLSDPETTKNSFGENLLIKITDQIDTSGIPRKGDNAPKLETVKDGDNVVTKDMNWYGDNEPELLDSMESEAKAGKDTDGAKKYKALFLAEYGESFDKANTTIA